MQIFPPTSRTSPVIYFPPAFRYCFSSPDLEDLWTDNDDISVTSCIQITVLFAVLENRDHDHDTNAITDRYRRKYPSKASTEPQNDVA